MTMFVKMNVTGLTIDPFTSMPIIILKDEEGKNALPIWIGLIEASSIATELENIKLTRPMTHDLLRNILETLKVKVRKVSVNELRDNTFYSSITIIDNGGTEYELDARPSDAFAVALRTKAPIFVEKSVIEKSRKIDISQETDDTEEARKRKWAEILENLSPEDFGRYKM